MSLVESIYQLNKTIGDFKTEDKNQSDLMKTGSNVKIANSVSLRRKKDI